MWAAHAAWQPRPTRPAWRPLADEPADPQLRELMCAAESALATLQRVSATLADLSAASLFTPPDVSDTDSECEDDAEPPPATANSTKALLASLEELVIRAQEVAAQAGRRHYDLVAEAAGRLALTPVSPAPGAPPGAATLSPSPPGAAYAPGPAPGGYDLSWAARVQGPPLLPGQPAPPSASPPAPAPRSGPRRRKPLAAPAPAPAPSPAPVPAPTAYVEAADGVYVEARLLPPHCAQPEAVLAEIRGPGLWYVPAWGHFALRLGDGLLHGGIGRVYPDDAPRPVGVAPCRRPGCEDPACTFYHDPARGRPGGVRVRNFMASSFAYASRFSPPRNALERAAARRACRYGGRHYGSAGALRADAAALADEEADRFLAQVAHDVVCAAALLQGRVQGAQLVPPPASASASVFAPAPTRRGSTA